jgi:hypothetical protein
VRAIARLASEWDAQGRTLDQFARWIGAPASLLPDGERIVEPLRSEHDERHGE